MPVDPGGARRPVGARTVAGRRVLVPARSVFGRLAGSWPGRVAEQSLREVLGIELFDRSMTLSAQAFTSLFPLLILVATLRPRQGDQVGAALADSLGLNPQARQALEAALPPAGSAASTFGAIGGLVVLLSATSFSRALVRMYVRIWDAPRPPALRSLWRLLAALLGFVLLVLLLTVARRMLAGVPLSGLAEGLVAFVLGGLLWTWVPWLLLARQIPVRMLIPGGVLMAVAMMVLSVAGRVYLPRALSSATRQFGALGVSFTYLTWLFVIMIALVASTAVGAVVARNPGPFTRVVGGGEAAPGPRR
jgi:membrane protein